MATMLTLDGSGSGSGSGSGYGYGYGYGDGSGDGDGYGYGSGYGYGDGSGSGYGYGGGVPMDAISGYVVAAHPPWGILVIGCEVHTSAQWRARWREIADKHGADVTDDDEAALMAALDAVDAMTEAENAQ